MWKHGMQNIIEEMLPTLDRLADKKALLDAQRPLPDFIVQKIKEGLNVEWTYNSNSIEGNTLTLNETKIVLEEGMTIGGKSLREHFEITNHHEAIEYLEGLVKPKYALTERDVLDIHELVMSKIGKDFAGRIRNVPVRITGANFIPPSVAKVPELLADLIDFVNENPLKLNTVLLASLFHHRFVWIHPFIDGNGRTVRLVMNLILMKKGYPPAIILRTDRKKYYDALNQANNGAYQKIALLMAQATERSLDIYLNSLPNTYKEIKTISSMVAEDEVPYGQEYISLLARQGKIAAYKEGRNWVTTEDAIAEYRKSRKRNRK
jgi:Fic family protein